MTLEVKINSGGSALKSAYFSRVLPYPNPSFERNWYSATMGPQIQWNFPIQPVSSLYRLRLTYFDFMTFQWMDIPAPTNWPQCNTPQPTGGGWRWNFSFQYPPSSQNGTDPAGGANIVITIFPGGGGN